LYRFKKIEHNVLELIPSLIEKFKADGDIICIYLFGSYAEGKQTPISDVDLAILLDKGFPADRFFKKKLELLALTTLLLKTDEVDLLILNEAPSVLAYRVLSKGRLLWVNKAKRSQIVNFQVRTYDHFFDFRPVERILHEGLIRRIKEGSFGGR